MVLFGARPKGYGHLRGDAGRRGAGPVLRTPTPMILSADLDAERKRVTEEELEGARDRQTDLMAQIERCRSLLETSRAWAGFEAAPFREAPIRPVIFEDAGVLTEEMVQTS